MPARLRAAAKLGSDLAIAAGAVTGGAWLAYAAAHGSDSSISVIGQRVSFGEELLLGSLLAAVGLFRGVYISWRADRGQRLLTELRTALADSGRREEKLWARISEILDAEIALMYRGARIGSEDRVSFFINDPAAGGLRLTNRYSWCQSHRRIDRDRIYPYDGGCMGKAWDSGDPVYHNFCDPLTDPRGWVAELEAWGIGRRESASMTLKARTVFARRVDTNDLPERPLGVVVVESRGIPTSDTSEISEATLRGLFGERADLLARLFALALELRAHHENVARNVGSTSR
jgi:hypothetical protein